MHQAQQQLRRERGRGRERSRSCSVVVITAIVVVAAQLQSAAFDIFLLHLFSGYHFHSPTTNLSTHAHTHRERQRYTHIPYTHYLHTLPTLAHTHLEIPLTKNNRRQQQRLLCKMQLSTGPASRERGSTSGEGQELRSSRVAVGMEEALPICALVCVVSHFKCSTRHFNAIARVMFARAKTK